MAVRNHGGHRSAAWAHPCHICNKTGLTPPTSAPGLGSPLPHLHRDLAHRCHICTGTGLAPPTSAAGLGSPLPHLRRDWARPSHICTGTGLARPTSAAGLGEPPTTWSVGGSAAVPRAGCPKARERSRGRSCVRWCSTSAGRQSGRSCRSTSPRTGFRTRSSSPGARPVPPATAAGRGGLGFDARARAFRSAHASVNAGGTQALWLSAAPQP